jgi:hypothetical protein
MGLDSAKKQAKQQKGVFFHDQCFMRFECFWCSRSGYSSCSSMRIFWP